MCPHNQKATPDALPPITRQPVGTNTVLITASPPPPSTVPSSDRLINGELRPEGAWRLSGASVRAERHQTAFDLIARPAGALCSLCSVSVCYLQSCDLCAPVP